MAVFVIIELEVSESTAILSKESSKDFLKTKHNKIVKIQGLAKLGLNENNDLKRAIIINEILSKPRAMKKNIR